MPRRRELVRRKQNAIKNAGRYGPGRRFGTGMKTPLLSELERRIYETATSQAEPLRSPDARRNPKGSAQTRASATTSTRSLATITPSAASRRPPSAITSPRPGQIARNRSASRAPRTRPPTPGTTIVFPLCSNFLDKYPKTMN